MLLPAVLELLLLADSALPTGAFTASAGWETAVRDRRIAGAEDVARWMHGALEDAVGPLELPVVARATRSPSPGPASTLLDRRIPVAAWRSASLGVGARLLGLAGERERPCHRAAAFGWLAGRAGAGAVTAAGAFAQAALIGQGQVAVRLGVVSGDDSVAAVRSLRPEVERWARLAADGRLRPSCAMRWEIDGMRQRRLASRLFAS
jgi:urease accessory protein UreF